MRKLWWVGAGVLLAWFLVSVLALMQPDPQIPAFRQAVDADLGQAPIEAVAANPSLTVCNSSGKKLGGLFLDRGTGSWKVTESGELAPKACATIRGLSPGPYFLRYILSGLCVYAIDITDSQRVGITVDTHADCMM
jgi:hypothetical protein